MILFIPWVYLSYGLAHFMLQSWLACPFDSVCVHACMRVCVCMHACVCVHGWCVFNLIDRDLY